MRAPFLGALSLLAAVAHGDSSVSAPVPPTPELPDRSIVCSTTRPGAGWRCTVAGDVLELLLRHPEVLARSARLVPALREGAPIGFKLYAIRSGSIFARLLFQDGDTILRVNGADLTSPETALWIYARTRETSHFVVALERKGRRLKAVIDVQR